MRIVYIASYGPRKCGIATFTGNTFLGMNCNSGSTGNEGIVVAMNDANNEYDYPEEVKFVIRQDNPSEYIDAAKFINDSNADICVLEHEFGIFGGRDGSYILSLLHRLHVPVIAVLHTVLKNPSDHQREITKEIAATAAGIVVMNNKAVEFLTQVYGISRGKISVIDHGIPAFEFDQRKAKKEFGLEDKNVLLTFGLISRNKGIETVLKALPPVVKKHPDTVYIILGKTHPSVVKNSGEEYRDYLKGLAKELEIEDHVLFVDEFTDERKLFKYLSAADIYVTAYLNEAQITSGTLSYAVGAGCAVISTPYWHAAELLTPDKGRLFDFNDHERLSEILSELSDQPVILNELRNNARAYGRRVTWPKIGEKYLTLARKIIKEQSLHITGMKARNEAPVLPPFALDHIRRMTDATGLFQHAKFGIPNYKEGYCLDDNARALLMVVMAYKQQKHMQAMDLMPVYFSYIHYMQNENGTFRNFLSFSRNFLDEVGSEDSFGRTIWALGYLLSNPTTEMHYKSAREIFLAAAPNFENLEHVRGIANTMIGISSYLEAADNKNMKGVLGRLANRLIEKYELNSRQDWKWFESVLTYDNAVLPLALLHAAEILKDERILSVAKESMEFLSRITLRNGYLSVIGNEKWFASDSNKSRFAQQPIDAMMMVLMFQKAYMLTGNKIYADRLHTCFMWFLGENDLQLHLYNRETKGCFDGLESYGVNHNQGAESTLAYLISYLTVTETVKAEEKAQKAEFVNSGIAV
jgi:glycosyltransferase involved in cell wall biosynthesis